MPNGDIALQRAEGAAEPLVIIQFSKETKVHLMDGTVEVARAMLQAGIQAAAQLAENGELEAEPEVHPDGSSGRVVH